MNVLGSRPDGWWRDRAAARRRLVGELAQLQQRTGDAIEVVFDGRNQPPEVDDGERLGVIVRFAPGGPNAADDVIALLVEGLEAPAATTVVTSDAALAARVRAAGGTVVGVSAFRRVMEGH